MEQYKIIEHNNRRKANNIETFPLQDKKFIVTNKPRGLYTKCLVRLKELEKEISPLSKKSYLPFSNLYSKLCRTFSMPSNEILEVLYLLNETGLITFVKFRGIKLNYGLKEVKVMDKCRTK